MPQLSKKKRERIFNSFKDMLILQDEFNISILGEDWTKKKIPFYRAAWMECAEIMNHLSWKWWTESKKPDIEKIKLEIVDIWHFYLAHLLSNSRSIWNSNGTLYDEEIHQEVENIVQEFQRPLGRKKIDLKSVIETIVADWSFEKGIDSEDIILLMRRVTMGWDELYKLYIGKLTLNHFRQDNGYKEGKYVKVWGDGKEDNEHLTMILDELEDPYRDEFRVAVYDMLQVGYEVTNNVRE